MRRERNIYRALTLVIATIALFHIPSVAAQTQAAAPKTCQALKSAVIPASAIKLPVRAVTITGATASVSERDGAFCAVLGRMEPIDPNGWAILFQVNLPDRWNSKAIQFGGGGTNGTLVTGLQNPRILPANAHSLVGQGYATFGTDAGHPLLKPEPQAFAENEEAVVNQAYAAYKKLHDVALELIRLRYSTLPRRTYFFGNSEGGREALLVAQRFHADYDGVIATVPAMDWVGQHLAHYREWIAQRDGGWLSPAKVRTLNASVLRQCDTLDGLADGVVSNQVACARTIDLRLLRCAGDIDADTCLTPPQMRFVETIYNPLSFAYPIANGVKDYPGSPYGGEAAAGGLAGGLMVREKPLPDDLGQPLPGPGSIRYFFTRDHGFSGDFDMIAYRSRVLALSRLYDATDPDLSAFANHGKIIVIDNLGDYLKSPFGSQHYFEAVQHRFGSARTALFFRYYQVPGLSHGGEGRDASNIPLPDRVDVLAMLEGWVEGGKAPDNVVIASYETPTPGATAVASRPLCVYPDYPHYRGRGDTKMSTSYVCVSSAKRTDKSRDTRRAGPAQVPGA